MYRCSLMFGMALVFAFGGLAKLQGQSNRFLIEDVFSPRALQESNADGYLGIKQQIHIADALVRGRQPIPSNAPNGSLGVAEHQNTAAAIAVPSQAANQATIQLRSTSSLFTSTTALFSGNAYHHLLPKRCGRRGCETCGQPDAEIEECCDEWAGFCRIKPLKYDCPCGDRRPLSSKHRSASYCNHGCDCGSCCDSDAGGGLLAGAKSGHLMNGLRRLLQTDSCGVCQSGSCDGTGSAHQSRAEAENSSETVTANPLNPFKRASGKTTATNGFRQVPAGADGVDVSEPAGGLFQRSYRANSAGR